MAPHLGSALLLMHVFSLSFVVYNVGFIFDAFSCIYFSDSVIVGYSRSRVDGFK